MAVRAQQMAAAALAAAAIAMPAEGLRRWAYEDAKGVITTCWGSTKSVDPNHHYSLEECRARLDQDMQEAIGHVERCVPGLPEHQLAALADAVFNLGPDVVCNVKKSSVARLAQAGRVEEACDALLRWNKVKKAGMAIELPGLTKRRQRERDLCQGRG